MKLPNWLKILWWLVLTGALTYFLLARLPDLFSGKAAAADVAVFGVWASLLLAPLFTEVSFLGVTLKNEIEEMRNALSVQLNDIRTDVRSAVDVRTTVSPQFNIPAPVADTQLPQLEERVKSAVSAALEVHGIKGQPRESPLTVNDDVAFLFATRYNIEVELRRIAQGRDVSSAVRRPLPSFQLVRTLSQAEVLEPSLGNVIREVYAVCSPAIHGEAVTEAQVEFVKDVGPQLVAALRTIQ